MPAGIEAVAHSLQLLLDRATLAPAHPRHARLGYRSLFC
jgi:hypothetical protein